MALYRVWGCMETYHYIDVEASSEEEAFDVASNADPSEFTPYPQDDDWRMVDEPWNPQEIGVDVSPEI